MIHEPHNLGAKSGSDRWRPTPISAGTSNSSSPKGDEAEKGPVRKVLEKLSELIVGYAIEKQRQENLPYEVLGEALWGKGGGQKDGFDSTRDALRDRGGPNSQSKGEKDAGQLEAGKDWSTTA